MRFLEFSGNKEITPESPDRIYFVIQHPEAKSVVRRKFGSKIGEYGSALVTLAKYWSLIKNLAYTSGGSAVLVKKPKTMHEDAEVITPEKHAEVDKMNNAGAGYVAHSIIDQKVQQAFAAKKPIKPVKLASET